MITFLLKLMLLPVYIVCWLITLPFKILFLPFHSEKKEKGDFVSTLGWCMLFHDLFD